ERRPRHHRARGWRRPGKCSGAGLCLAVEARGAARADRPPASGHGFQRSASGPRAARWRIAMSIDDPIDPESVVADVIDAAEEIYDPLDGLVERTKTDPSA